MQARHWMMFAAWQLAGSLIGLGAHHVDALSWMISGLMLLPGTVVSWYVFKPGGLGNTWQKWPIFAVAASANILLFTIVSLVKRKRATST